MGDRLDEAELTYAYASLDSHGWYAETAQISSAKVERAVSDLRGRLDGTSGAASVLDVGCGFGHLLRAVRERHPSARLVGQELDEASAEACRREGFEVRLGGDLDGLSERFSIVTALDVAEHVADPGKLFGEVRDRIEDGGVLYLHTPRRCIWDSLFLALLTVPILHRLALVWLTTRVSIFHLRLWSDAALRRFLHDAGFSVTRLERVTELSCPLETYTRIYLNEQIGLPMGMTKVATKALGLLFGRLPFLRNKAIVHAAPRPLPARGGFDVGAAVADAPDASPRRPRRPRGDRTGRRRQ